MKFGEMLAQMVRARASDIHLQAGAPPMVRVDGELLPFDKKPLTPAHTEAMAKALTTEAQWKRFLNEKELDFAYVLPGVARFRCNLLRQRGAVGIVMRVVPASVPTFEVLGLPRGWSRNWQARVGAWFWSRGRRDPASRPPWRRWWTTSTAITPST